MGLNLLSASAAEIGFRWDPDASMVGLVPGLPLLRQLMAGPVGACA